MDCPATPLSAPPTRSLRIPVPSRRTPRGPAPTHPVRAGGAGGVLRSCCGGIATWWWPSVWEPRSWWPSACCVPALNGDSRFSSHHARSASTLPAGSLPQSPLTSTGQAVGSRAAISLEKGTVLTASMTSGGMAQELGADERLVQVPVDVGAELARPGARVDVIGQAPEGWSPQAQDEASQGAPTQNPAEPTETPTTQSSPENSSTMSPSTGPDTSSSSSNQESPGIQEPSQSISQAMPVGPFGTHSAVLCSGARVMMIQQAGEDGRWTGNKKVTLITLAIPASSATLVVGAATNSTLGIALSP